MNTLNLILRNKWHLHMPIGNLAMLVAMFFMTFEDTLGPIGKVVIATIVLTLLFIGFEFLQSHTIPSDSKPPMAVMMGDVLAGLAGVVVYIICMVTMKRPEVVTIVLLLIGAGLHIYKLKNTKK